MADQPKEKKPRTAAQAAANQLGRNAAKWLEERKLPKQISYISIVKKGLADKLTSPEIKAQVEAKKVELNAKAAEKKAAPAKPKTSAAAAPAKPKTSAAAAAPSGNGTRNNKPKANNGNGKTKKVRTAAQLAANEASKARMQAYVNKFAEAGVRFGPNTLKYYTAQRTAGKNAELILAEMKPMFPALNDKGAKVKGPPRAARTQKAKPANVVAPAVVVANGSVAKGQYICDRCRLVANNTRRNNSPKPRANGNGASGSGSPSGSSGNNKPKVLEVEGMAELL
jgi:hypothetical protein